MYLEVICSNLTEIYVRVAYTKRFQALLFIYELYLKIFLSDELFVVQQSVGVADSLILLSGMPNNIFILFHYIKRLA